MSLPSIQTNVPRNDVGHVVENMLINQDAKKINIEPEDIAATFFKITPFGSLQP